MSIVESDGPRSWSLDASETGGSTKYPLEGVMGFVLLPYQDQRPRWQPVGLNDRHLRSHGKIGDCEQSSMAVSP